MKKSKVELFEKHIDTPQFYQFWIWNNLERMGQLNRVLPKTGFQHYDCLLHNNPSSPVTSVVPLFSSGTWLANWCQQPGPKRIPGISNNPTIYRPIFKLCRKRTIGPNKCVMGWSWPFTYYMYVQKSFWRLDKLFKI